MDAITMIKERRSIRKYKNEIVPKEIMESIIDAARFAPSWANAQISRYTIVTDETIIKKISETGVNNFAYNMKTLENTNNLVVLSYVKGKSGILKTSNDYATNKKDKWEMFDAGIACQTFCLAAFEKQIGTCIFGMIDDEVIAKLINLPQDQTVAAVITYGFIDEEAKTPNHKEVSEITRFI